MHHSSKLTLPCTQVQLSVCDWDCNAHTDKAALDMPGHIVTSFCVMAVYSLVLLIFNYNSIHGIRHIQPDIAIYNGFNKNNNLAPHSKIFLYTMDKGQLVFSIIIRTPIFVQG